MDITFYNIKRSGITTDEFINNPNFKAAGGGAYNHSEKNLITILSKSVPEVLPLMPMMDYQLNMEQTIKVKAAVLEKIRTLLIGREILKVGTDTIDVEVEKIILDVRPTQKNPMDYALYFNYYSIYDICRECINENKPMYLCIEEEDED